MLFKDFLRRNATQLSEQQVLFDWSWPDARYELKVNRDLEISHRLISRDGKIGPWTTVRIKELREFRVITASVLSRRLVRGHSAVRLITDDGMGRRSF